MSRRFPEFGYNPVTGQWNDSLEGEYLWSNVNVSEAVPDVMTPSTWSLWWIYHYEASPFRFPGSAPFCGNICGRPYLNLSLLVSVYRALGRDARSELQADMVYSVPFELNPPMIRFSTLQVVRHMMPGLLQTRRQAMDDLRHLRQFVAVMPGWCRTNRAAIQQFHNPGQLQQQWKTQLKPALLRACRMLRSVTMTLAEPATHLRQELVSLVGDIEATALLTNLSAGSTHLASLAPLVGLAQVQKGRLTREQYMERYGHRGAHEMELFIPGPEDELDWFNKSLAGLEKSSTDVETLLEKQHVQFRSAWERFKIRFPGKARAFQHKLDGVAEATRDREAVRSEVTRLARLVRSYLLRAGELTGLGSDPFFLSLDETSALLGGDRSPLQRIPARRDSYLQCSALPPYPALIIGAFDPFKWVAEPRRRTDIYDYRNAGAIPSGEMLRGSPGAAGKIEGVVRRLDRVEDGEQLQPGEILVTVTTNVGWTPLFPRLSAIITDVGAPLSHAAIVARELGIPAVVGCGNATSLLKTGDRVRVDGSNGTVTLLHRS